MQLKDIFGNSAFVGDKIAAGMSRGQSSVLRIGEIIGIKDKDDGHGGIRWSIRVKWTHNGPNDYKWGVKESTILYHSSYSYAKFVILPSDFVEQYPPDIKDDK